MNQEDRAALHKMTLELRAALKRRFPRDVHNSRRSFRDLLIKEIRAVFPLRIGRPRDPVLNRVERLKRQQPGLSYRDIARQVVPGFKECTVDQQRLYLSNMRQAMKERRRREKKIRSRLSPRTKLQPENASMQNPEPPPQSSCENEDA